jgi:hypothetical protein
VTKAEREMVVVATSGRPVVHLLRRRPRRDPADPRRDPHVADLVATNHRQAGCPSVSAGCSTFAVTTMSTTPELVGDARPRGLRRVALRRRGHLGHQRDHQLLRLSNRMPTSCTAAEPEFHLLGAAEGVIAQCRAAGVGVGDSKGTSVPPTAGEVRSTSSPSAQADGRVRASRRWPAPAHRPRQ